MKLWLSKNSEVPVREQLVAQITLGIASGELAVGARLPSTREIALRYQIHFNTVSNAYHILAGQGWLEFRPGSGFYVRELDAGRVDDPLDRLIAGFVRAARGQGYSTDEIGRRLARFLETAPTRRLCLVENDEALRKILVEEIRAATDLDVSGIGLADLPGQITSPGVKFAAMFDEKKKLGELLPDVENCLFLKTSSPAATMKGETRPRPNDLIAVVSGWENFLLLAKIMLVAAQIDPDCLVLRSTRVKSWNKGLRAASMIICDSLTAKKLARYPNVRVFRLISDDSLAELRRLG
ncbi:MAG: GntR family transcriptional regulator [Acidobacteria bacterium]|nr:GntR family transcriptional regulator [Acidobacteriota bacterium]